MIMNHNYLLYSNTILIVCYITGFNLLNDHLCLRFMQPAAITMKVYCIYVQLWLKLQPHSMIFQLLRTVLGVGRL